jgi:hypothetical protein
VVEFQAPAEGVPGRLSWTAKQDGTPEERLDVLQAWLVEDLPGGRVRVLTQETQIGQPAAAVAGERPDPLLNGHQAVAGRPHQRRPSLSGAASHWLGGGPPPIGQAGPQQQAPYENRKSMQ